LILREGFESAAPSGRVGTEERAEALEGIAASVRVCTRCRLHKGRAHAVPGEGLLDADLFVIGEAPGRQEDASGRPFVGSAGKVLDHALTAAQLSRQDVFITNLVKCRPPGNRPPRTDEIEACRPYLMRQIDAVRPKVLVTLGSTSLQGLLGSRIELAETRGKRLDVDGSAVLPTYHPAAVLYNRRLERVLRNDLREAARIAREKPSRIRSGPPRKGQPTRKAQSSGAVIVDSKRRVFLLRKAAEGIWVLPKGTVEPGETLDQTAVREVREETGFRVRLVRPLLEVSYTFYWPPDRTNVDKTVSYFLAKPIGGRLQPEPGFDEARWVSREEASKLLRWPNDRAVVQEAFAAIDSKTLTSGTRGPSRGAKRSTRRHG